MDVKLVVCVCVCIAHNLWVCTISKMCFAIWLGFRVRVRFRDLR